MIWSANQGTGFCMIGTSVMKELMFQLLFDDINPDWDFISYLEIKFLIVLKQEENYCFDTE